MPPQVEKDIFDAVAGKTSDIVIDAEKLEYISSAGLRVLMKLCKSMEGKLPVINVQRDVYDIFETTGFVELFDIGDAATGHPVFDIAGLMLAYIIIPASRGGTRSDDELRGLLGFDFQLAQKVWGVMCGAYFGVQTPEQIGAITQKLMPYCLLMMTYHAVSILGNKEEIKVRVERVLRQRLLPAIDGAQPLDF